MLVTFYLYSTIIRFLKSVKQKRVVFLLHLCIGDALDKHVSRVHM